MRTIKPTKLDPKSRDEVVDKERVPYLCVTDLCNASASAVVNGSQYKVLVIQDKVKFLDLMNYLPQCSLDKRVQDYKMDDRKGFFPYSVRST